MPFHTGCGVAISSAVLRLGKIYSGCGVTANMLDLGSSDSGFESQHPDTEKTCASRFFRCRGAASNGNCLRWDSNSGTGPTSVDVGVSWCPGKPLRRQGLSRGRNSQHSPPTKKRPSRVAFATKISFIHRTKP